MNEFVWHNLFDCHSLIFEKNLFVIHSFKLQTKLSGNINASKRQQKQKISYFSQYNLTSFFQFLMRQLLVMTTRWLWLFQLKTVAVVLALKSG